MCQFLFNYIRFKYYYILNYLRFKLISINLINLITHSLRITKYFIFCYCCQLRFLSLLNPYKSDDATFRLHNFNKQCTIYNPPRRNPLITKFTTKDPNKYPTKKLERQREREREREREIASSTRFHFVQHPQGTINFLCTPRLR